MHPLEDKNLNRIKHLERTVKVQIDSKACAQLWGQKVTKRISNEALGWKAVCNQADRRTNRLTLA